MEAPKQKFSIWFTKEQARRFDAVWKLAKSRNRGRAEASEVMKELMGFPLEEGVEPLLIDSDREIIGRALSVSKAQKRAGPVAKERRAIG